MRFTLLLIAALSIVVLAPRIRAQEGGDEGGEQPQQQAPPPPAAMSPTGGAPQGGEGGDGGEGGGEQAPAENAGPAGMNADDARVNMFTLLQSFLAARSVDGVWPLKSKSEKGRLLKLRLDDKELKKVHAAGPRRYSGMLAFTDVRTGKPYDCDFLVDMGGSEWQVVGMKLSPGKKKAAKGKAKAKAKQEDEEAPAGDAAEAAPSGDAQ